MELGLVSFLLNEYVMLWISWTSIKGLLLLSHISDSNHHKRCMTLTILHSFTVVITGLNPSAAVSQNKFFSSYRLLMFVITAFADLLYTWNRAPNKRWWKNLRLRQITRYILTTATQLYKTSHLKKLAGGEWPWRSLNVIGIVAIRQANISLPFSGL